ncbi:hypothetical protein Gpo141_00012436 [Globisporangium polare]
MERRRSPSYSSSNDSPDNSPVKRQQPHIKTQLSSSAYTSSPVHESEHRSPRAPSPPATFPDDAPRVSELAYQHYRHYHNHQQPQQHSPHMRPQSRLLPSVFIPSHHVTQSPVAQGISTPRLPPISMLTAAASLQPRMQRQASSSSSGPATRSPAAVGPPPASHLHAEDQENLCRYRNKRCGYPRAIKRNGDRHNLCEKHRAKANQNQRKLESKRRVQKKAPTTPSSGPEPNQQHHAQPQHPHYHTSTANNGISAHETLKQAARRESPAPAYPPHREYPSY